jgi:methylthioribose-1-phosphate isomerase
MTIEFTGVRPLRWVGTADAGYIELLEQRALPASETWNAYDTSEGVAQAITDMVVRGAPAIGITAAYGLVLAAREAGEDSASMKSKLAHMRLARPTAVNLMWAVDQVAVLWESTAVADRVAAIFSLAQKIEAEDLAANRALGDAGAAAIPGEVDVLTICNTGSLATAGYGTAAGVIRSLHSAGRLNMAWALETRPYLQGARLTTWELMRDGVPVTLITDGMAGHLMKTHKISAVVVGADRIARNGDSANKIGTYQLAVLAKHHGVPFYVAAPTSTVDLATLHGNDIPIEERSADEIAEVRGVRIAPEGVRAFHPAFDVTPNDLIAGIITERGIATAPYSESLPALLGE